MLLQKFIGSFVYIFESVYCLNNEGIGNQQEVEKLIPSRISQSSHVGKILIGMVENGRAGNLDVFIDKIGPQCGKINFFCVCL